MALTTKEASLDVAIVDRQLPDGRSLDVVEHLKQRFDPFEVILTSTDPTTDLVVQAMDAGAFDLVAKPFSNLRLLTHKVVHAVGKVRAERQVRELSRSLPDTGEAGVTDSSSGSLSAIDFNAISGIDPLTGLPNRRAAEDRFRIETARALRYDRPLCIALCSIDDLDVVADRFGREVTDGVIRGIVQLFSGLVRDVDFLARPQGGDFFFIFPETGKDGGFVVVDRIRQKLVTSSFSDDLSPDGHFHLTGSFGVAGLPTDTMNAELLKRAADVALARARNAGGDQVVLFEPGLARR